MNPNTEADRRLTPLRTGFLCAILAFAGLTAASWFIRSESWGNLCGYTKSFQGEAIGFPFEFWRINRTHHGGWLIDFPTLILNVAIALLVGTALGLIFTRYRNWFADRFAAHRAYDANQKHNAAPTFSLRGLLFFTTVLAGSIAAFQKLGPSPELLACIIFGGPAILLAIAMFPSAMRWENRAWIIVGFAGLLMASAIAIGSHLSMPFDRVLFGVFISWVPQSVAGAALATLFMLVTSPPQESTSQ